MYMSPRVVVFMVFAGLTAFSAHLFFGSAIFAAAEKDVFQIILRDTYREEMHELSGMVLVPSDCHDVSVRTKDFDASMIFIIFETWEQPYRECEKAETPRAVRIIAFAPENITFRGLMDNELVPLTIVRAQ